MHEEISRSDLLGAYRVWDRALGATCAFYVLGISDFSALYDRIEVPFFTSYGPTQSDDCVFAEEIEYDYSM